ncbi:hypothetical protein CFOL_v3_05037 [Cephalotus follicularis]|uniref:Uncharacterized protein n=1 Tax=Cephalotus follicularis TaxID=3775 RepID=A0A1Q3B0M5_CEPFO|nr:hypothetical protein CFOL_v3_05037 [Cephalotus follicularis]
MFLKERRGEGMDGRHILHFFKYEAENKKYVIWALTARILIRVASLVYLLPPAFLEQRPNSWNRSGL